MRTKIALAMMILSFASAVQAQEMIEVATDRDLGSEEFFVDFPQMQMNSKFGIELLRHLDTQRIQTLSKKAIKEGAKEEETVNVMVMLQPSSGVTPEVLEQAGCKVHWSMKSQAFVSAPLNKLDDIANINGVLSLNLPQTYQVQNDIAREETKVSWVTDTVAAEKAGLPQTYDGSGVIVGVVDNGIDFEHPAFRNADGTTRIKRAFTYRRTDKIGPDEPESSWKNTYTDPEEILNVIPLTNKTHGSHTMGTAAGSNTGNDLQGMAPGADLVPADLAVLSDNYLISGLKSICEYAQEVGKPVVTNYSIAGTSSFRDGCNPVSQAIIELTENGTKPGVIFSLSAGNEGYNDSQVNHTFTSDNEKLYVMMDVPSAIVKVNSLDGPMNTHLLHTTESLTGYANQNVANAEDMLVAYSLSEKRMIDPDEKIGFATLYKRELGGGSYMYYITPQGKNDKSSLLRISLNDLRKYLKRGYYYWEYTHNCCDGETQKREFVFSTTKDMTIYLFEDIRLGACFSLPAGTDLTVSYLANNNCGNLIKPEGFDFVQKGSAYGNLNESACNMANITVGSYNVRNAYTTYFGDSVEFNTQIGEVSYFSSYGHTNDGNNLAKPEVLAPGSFILSAVNGYYGSYFDSYGILLYKELMSTSKYLAQKVEFEGQDYWYEYMQGTSMAAPVVTGIIALWLQADPTLSVRDIRDVLAHSSVPYMGSDPVKSSLYGKIDALAGLKYITDNRTGVINIDSPQTKLTDNRTFMLDGREVNGTPKAGIYISGGRKVLYK